MYTFIKRVVQSAFISCIQYVLEDPRSNPQYGNSRVDQQQTVGFRGINIENSAQSQGVKVSQSRGNVLHSTNQGALDKNINQVTVLGDSPTDYVAAGTRSGDFMGVPKTKASAQGTHFYICYLMVDL